jgi:hypothetical protein
MKLLIIKIDIKRLNKKEFFFVFSENVETSLRIKPNPIIAKIEGI